ncbi:MAG: hypothetical protein OEO23_12770 [Gemmatimonadota bacterium]|nr:hypothetical protein [Gemmatimonadota bacterium]
MIRFPIAGLAATVAWTLATPGLEAQTTGTDWFQEGYAWQTAGGRYLDPASFFSLHGYVNGVYAGPSRDWAGVGNGQLPAPGQLLIPNTNHASFQYDAALFIGSEPNSRTSVMIEAHFVTDPSARGAAGPGGLTVAFTEATASYSLVPEHLRLSAGLYWAPFSTLNLDWLSAQNLFSLVPDASAAFPSHYNERGIRADGAFRIGSRSGLNYVVSLGNGVSGFGIGDQIGFDTNSNQTVIGRIGLFPGLERRVEVGISGAHGVLRTDGDAARTPSEPDFYPSTMEAVGVDATVQLGGFALRSHGTVSYERLEDFQTLVPDDLRRVGFMAEASYAFTGLEMPAGFTRLVPRIRFDWYSADELDGTGAGGPRVGSRTTSLGLTLASGSVFSAGGEYHFREELGRAVLENDRLVLKLTAQF